MLPNLQLARGWSDLAEPREWEEQQVWYCWEEQSTLRHSRRNLYRENILPCDLVINWKSGILSHARHLNLNFTYCLGLTLPRGQ